MTLFTKLYKLLYPKGYLQSATGEQAPAHEVEQCDDSYCNVPLTEFLIPTIRWDEKKKDYVAIYRMPKNVHRYR